MNAQIRVAAGSQPNIHEPIRIKVDRTDWMEQALCVGRDPEWWTTADAGRRPNLSNERWDQLEDASKNNIRAVRLCQQCPVRLECLEFALKDRQCREHGVFGGTFPHEREAMVTPK